MQYLCDIICATFKSGINENRNIPTVSRLTNSYFVYLPGIHETKKNLIHFENF